jgi:rubrerythrin
MKTEELRGAFDDYLIAAIETYKKALKVKHPNMQGVEFEVVKRAGDDIAATVAELLATAKEETARRYEDALTEIEKNARTLQAGLCCYGTREGDRHPCDCKFYTEPEKRTGTRLDNGYFLKGLGSEVAGCCEARSIIWKVREIRAQVAQGKDGE